MINVTSTDEQLTANWHVLNDQRRTRTISSVLDFKKLTGPKFTQFLCEHQIC